MREPVLVHGAPTLSSRFKDALAVAFVALLLGIPMVGLTTVDQGGALQVATRWPMLFAWVLAVFAGRFALRYAIDRYGEQKVRRERSGAPSKAKQGAGVWSKHFGWLGFALALLLPIAFSDNRYVVDTATTVLIYVMLGWGLNVVVGLAGLLDLGHVAFYAVGAYAYA